MDTDGGGVRVLKDKEGLTGAGRLLVPAWQRQLFFTISDN